MSEQNRDTSIQLHVKLDEKNLPVDLKWEASDSPIKGQKDCKAFMLSIWDTQQAQTLRIDLWTKEMKTDEMTHFIFQTIATMSDVLQRSTNNAELANDMRQFARQFALKSGILPPQK
jgi:gliding motility-associated protein GldC